MSLQFRPGTQHDPHVQIICPDASKDDGQRHNVLGSESFTRWQIVLRLQRCRGGTDVTSILLEVAWPSSWRQQTKLLPPQVCGVWDRMWFAASLFGPRQALQMSTLGSLNLSGPRNGARLFESRRLGLG